MVNNYMLNKVKDKTKEILDIEKNDDTKILIDTDDKIPDDILDMYEKASDACLPALKLVPDWLILSKMLEISNDDIELDCIDYDIVTILSDDIDINITNFNNNKLDNNHDNREYSRRLGQCSILARKSTFLKKRPKKFHPPPILYLF